MAIRLEIDNIEIDLYEGVENELAQTFQVQNINGASVVSSSFSTTIQVPLTSDNRSVFDFEISSNDYSNYQFRRATLLINGTPVLNRLNGGACVVEEVFNDSISITLYSNNFALFSVISELTTGDLSIDLTHNVDYESIVTLYGNSYTDGFTYAINTNNVDNIFDGNNKARTIYAYPFFFLRYFFEKIFEEQGFTVSGAFLSDIDFSKLVFTTDYESYLRRSVGYVDVPQNNPVVGDLFNNLSSTTRQIGIDTMGDLNGIDTSLITLNDGNPIVPTPIDVKTFLITEGFFGKISFKAGMTVSYNYVPTSEFEKVFCTLYSSTKGVISFQILDSGANNIDIQVEQQFETGEKFYVIYEIPQIVANGNNAVLIVTSVEHFFIGDYDYTKYKPKINQLDLVKYVMNRYDLIATINYRTNDVKFTKFDDLKDNSVDWSNKIDFSKGYLYDPHSESLGQNNTLDYANENEDYRGVLVVNDKTLSPNNDYYTSIFSIEENRKSFGINSPTNLDTTNIKIIDPDLEIRESIKLKVNNSGDLEFQVNQDFDLKEGDIIRVINSTNYNYDYIVNVDTQSGTIVPVRNSPLGVTDQGFEESDVTIERIRGNNNSPENLPVLTVLGNQISGIGFTDFVRDEFYNDNNTVMTDSRLSFQNNIDDNYILRTKAYDKYKLLKAYFKLSLVDIQQLDFSKSVYINATDLNGRQINGYFYLNKVEQYKNNESTRCELLKL